MLNDGSTIPYAFGISHGVYRGAPTLSHSGSWAAFVSFLVNFPQQKTGVVVLANTPAVNTSRTAYALADIFFGDALGAMAAAPLAATGAVDISISQLDRYAGVYRLGPAWYVRIRRQDTALIAHVPGELPAGMVARTRQEFWVQNYGASMTFADASARPATHLTYRSRRADRVDERGMSPPVSLAEYTGTYASDELGIAYPIEVREKSLVLRSRQHGDIRLTHRWRDDFSGAVGAMRSVNFQRDHAERIVGFLVNVDERSRDIRFVRQKQTGDSRSQYQRDGDCGRNCLHKQNLSARGHRAVHAGHRHAAVEEECQPSGQTAPSKYTTLYMRYNPLYSKYCTLYIRYSILDYNPA